MRRVLLMALCCCSGICTSWAVDLPKTWKVCKVSEKNREACMKDAAQTAVAFLMNGDKTIGVPPLDPMRIERTDMRDSGNEKGSFNFQLTLTNYILTGFKSAKFDNFQLDCSKGRMSFNATMMDDVSLKGHYNGSGKILLISVDASGDFLFVFSGYTLGCNVIMSQIDKKDGKHFKIESMTVSLQLPKARIHYSNLFNGNKLLENNLNDVMNENWDALFEEMKNSLDVSMASSFRGYFIEPILERIPVNMLCPK